MKNVLRIFLFCETIVKQCVKQRKNPKKQAFFALKSGLFVL